MFANLKELFAFRELLFTWTKRDFRVRYSQSVLGAAWAILQPFVLMLVFTVVFSIFIKLPTDDIPYPLFVYTAILPWTFFANTLSFSIPSLVNNMSLVSKIYFPREIFPLSSMLVCFIDYLIAGIIYILLIIYYHVQIKWVIILFPLIILLQIIFSFGISLFASALMVFYHDIRFIVPLILQVWMYATPIFYSTNSVPERFKTLYFLNPMATFISTYRKITILGETPDWLYLGISTLISILILIFSYSFFKKVEKDFADII